MTRISSRSRPIAFGHFDLNLIATLAVLLQTRSVTGTARRLGLSQPTVSRSLAQLRQLLDDPLLVRTNGGMQRTRRAEDLVAPIEQWLASTTSLLHPTGFAPAALDRCFRIASTDYGVLVAIAPALAAIAAAAPAVVVEVVPFSADMMQKLASGEIDLILTGLEPDRALAYDRRLFFDSYSIVMRAGHPLAQTKESIGIDDFLAWPHIGIVVSDQAVDGVDVRLGARAAERRVVTRLPYFHSAPALIADSDMLMTVPTRAATRFVAVDGLVSRPAPPEVCGLDYRLLWHERTARDPATRWLADMLAEGCASAR